MANAVLFDPDAYGTVQHNVLCRCCQDDTIRSSSTGFCDPCLADRGTSAFIPDEGYYFAFCWGTHHMTYVPIQLMYTREVDDDGHGIVVRHLVCNFCTNVRPLVPNHAALRHVPAAEPFPPRHYIRRYRPEYVELGSDHDE